MTIPSNVLGVFESLICLFIILAIINIVVLCRVAIYLYETFLKMKRRKEAERELERVSVNSIKASVEDIKNLKKEFILLNKED